MNTVRKGKLRPTKGVLYFRGISPHVKFLFKSTAYRRGDNMTQVVEALMDLYTKDPTVVRVKKKRK